jgi:pimeloyl-ACP methyl ester carboxylesterase
MHDEARVALPELLKALRIDNPVLVGHSDGASIALIHAGSGHPVRGVAVEAPHVFVEEHGLAGIVEAKQAFESGSLREGLAKYHRDAEKTFHGWNEVWLSAAFRSWNIEKFLPGIQCPVLAIQGVDDQYGTMAQLDSIARNVKGRCELLKLENCGHTPHRDQPQAVLAALVRFVESLLKEAA